MSQKLYELALEIQGKLDGSFSSAMKSAQGDLKTLEGEVKAWQDRQKNVSGTDAAYIKAREGARQLGIELAKLKRQQQDISAYQAQRKSTEESARAYRNVQRELRALTAAYKQDKTPANKKAMQDAAKQAKALEKEYNKNKTTLTKMGEKLKGAGVDTKNLGGEQDRLAQKIARVTKEQERYNRAANRITNQKAAWANLKDNVASYFGTMRRVATWTVGISTALGASAYMITKSTAEAGDKAKKLGDAVGATSEEIQQLQFVAGEANVENFSNVLKTMKQNADLAALGQGKALKAFKDFKINGKLIKAQDFVQYGAVDQILLISEALQQVKKDAIRTELLKGFFGSQWETMKIMLKDGPKAIKEGMKLKESYGTISNETSALSEDFMNSINRMNTAIQGLKNTIGSDLMPIVQNIVKEITEWVKQNREVISDKVKDFVLWLQESLPVLWEKFKDGKGWISDFLEVIKGGIEHLGKFTTTLEVLLGVWTGAKLLRKFKILDWMGKHGTALTGVGADAAGSASIVAGEVAAGSGGLAGMLFPGAAGLSMGPLFGVGILAEAISKALGKGEGEHYRDRPEDFGRLMSYAELQAAQEKTNRLREEAKQALPQPQAIAKMTPPPIPSSSKGTVSPLPDEQVKPFFDIVSIARGIEEQSMQRVSKEDFDRYGTVMASYLQGNEQAIRDLPERLRPVLEALRPTQSPIIEHHARGGFVSTPTISTLAERGGEMVVPTADADRSLGISRLVEAARKLGVPTKLDIPKLNIPAPAAPQWDIPKLNIPAPAAPQWDIPKQDIPAPAAPKWDIPRLLKSLQESSSGTTGRTAPESTPNINLSQTFTITGTDAQDMVEQVGNVTKQAIIEAIQEYQDEMRRVDYAT